MRSSGSRYTNMPGFLWAKTASHLRGCGGACAYGQKMARLCHRAAVVKFPEIHKTGGISIYLSAQQPHTLVIADTGGSVLRLRICPGCLKRALQETTAAAKPIHRSWSLSGKKIMKRLNHGIYLESEPGKGTKVYLNLARKKREIY